MAQWEKALATKADDMNWIPEIQKKKTNSIHKGVF